MNAIILLCFGYIQQLVERDPEGQWLFIADQLNTHKSASLVTWIAEQCALKDDLGKKAKRVFCRICPQEPRFCRMDESHRIRFIARGSIR